MFRILYKDEHFVVIDKPAGFQVHPHENPQHRLSRLSNCLFLLRKQLGTPVYPVHRLDRATSGVLLFGLSPEAASAANGLFSQRLVKKTYFAVVRGWVDEQGFIDHPLKSDSSVEAKEAQTRFWRVGTLELPFAVGRYATTRCSLVRVEPETGRMHQIRRHFDHLSHPLVGDTVYGDGRFNRAFRELFGEKALLLKAYSLEFEHPLTKQALKVRSRWSGLWHKVFDLFGICPF